MGHAWIRDDWMGWVIRVGGYCMVWLDGREYGLMRDRFPIPNFYYLYLSLVD
jgi:hypothetical protein